MDKTTVLIAGTHNDTDAYPNVRHRIKCMEADKDLHVIHCNYGSSTSINYSSRSTELYSMVSIAVSLILQTARSVSTIIKHRHVQALYIPYPSIFILFVLSILPKRCSPPKVIADSFISIYDTLIIDRALFTRASMPAIVLRKVEQIAMRRATYVITDTVESADHYSNTLDVDRERLIALPLSINESNYAYSQYIRRKKTHLNVLFIGTLVPLHRIEVILDAIKLLTRQDGINITLVGDGQQAYMIEQLIESQSTITDSPTFTWIKDWQNSKQLHDHIKSSDVCLGIMGKSGKSDRVWPFKNYLYMATGRALITASTTTARRLAELSENPSFILLEECTGQELVACLKRLHQDQAQISSLSCNARTFFDSNLARDSYQSQLRILISH